MDKTEIFYKNGFIQTDLINESLGKNLFKKIESATQFLKLGEKVAVTIMIPDEFETSSRIKIKSSVEELFKAFGMLPEMQSVRPSADVLSIKYFPKEAGK